MAEFRQPSVDRGDRPSPRADVRTILSAQAARAFGYGTTSVLLGATAESRGWSSLQVGVLLGSIVAGGALVSVLVGVLGDRVGRRRAYAVLFEGLGVSGVVFALPGPYWLLVAVALAGCLSTEVVESGPFTSLEQAMLAERVTPARRARTFATYNTVATLAGSIGAVAAAGPALLRGAGIEVPDRLGLLILLPAGLVGLALSTRLSREVEPAAPTVPGPRSPRSRGTVRRLAGLFAVDSLGGGFVVQSFIAYWFARRFGLRTETIAGIFFAVGLLQAASFLLAARLAERFGLLRTMVFTHLPSNLLLAAIPLAPTAPVAVALLLGRFALSQMDVPARQAYVAALVPAEERTAAVAYTNTARAVVRPVGPVVGGAMQQLAFGLPFVVAGALKSAYDLALWYSFRDRRVEGSR